MAEVESVLLHQSFPNPTTGEATIKFDLSASTSIKMDLVNMYGQQVATLATGTYSAGSHEVIANTSNLASGVYFYNLHAGNEVYTKKMVVVK